MQRVYAHPVPMIKLNMRVVALKRPVQRAKRVRYRLLDNGGSKPSVLSSGGTLSNDSPWLPVKLDQQWWCYIAVSCGTIRTLLEGYGASAPSGRGASRWRNCFRVMGGAAWLWSRNDRDILIMGTSGPKVRWFLSCPSRCWYQRLSLRILRLNRLSFRRAHSSGSTGAQMGTKKEAPRLRNVCYTADMVSS